MNATVIRLFERDRIHIKAEGNQRPRGDAIMFDLTITEQLAQATAPSKQHDGASTRAARFQRASEDEALSFLLQFKGDERIVRFGAPVSDCAIRNWRAKIDRTHYLAISLAHGRELVGLVELFGSKLTGWTRPELALSLPRGRDTSSLCSHLLEIGLNAAREQGAADVFVYSNSTDTLMPAIMCRYGGTLDHESGIAVIPCDFAAAHSLASWRRIL